MDNYKKALNAMSWYINMLSQIVAYSKSWSPEYSVHNAKESTIILEEFLQREIDFTKFSIEELLNLGFNWYNKDRNLLLCPLWLASYLFPDVNHDHRMGNICFGFNVDKGIIDFQSCKSIG